MPATRIALCITSIFARTPVIVWVGSDPALRFAFGYWLWIRHPAFHIRKSGAGYRVAGVGALG